MLYPIGIQNFEDLRRFDKSLLISTMEAYFSGKKELFIIELKIDNTADAALRRIEERKVANGSS